MTRSRKVYILMRAGVIGPAPEPARDGGSFVCLSEKAHRLGHAEACPPVEGSKEVGLWVGGGGMFVVVVVGAMVDYVQPVQCGQPADRHTRVPSLRNWQAAWV